MRLSLALALVLASTGLALPTAAHAAPDASRADDGEHLVVWMKQKGAPFQVRAADLDGSDERVIYRLKRERYAGSLTLNGAGTEVAFIVSDAFAGAKPRLVFHGEIMVRGERRNFLWSVRADGGGLRRLAPLLLDFVSSGVTWR